MNNSWNHLQEARRRLAALQKIREDMDPASGVSFSVRRGVARNDPNYEDDETRRPWVTVETGDMRQVDDMLVLLAQVQNKSIAFWTKMVRDDIRDATKILEEGNQ